MCLLTICRWQLLRTRDRIVVIICCLLLANLLIGLLHIHTTSPDRISLLNVFNKFYAFVNLTTVFPPNLNPFTKECVCVPPCLSVCVCICARSFLDFRQVGFGKLIQPARSRSRSVMQQPLPADYRLPFYFCWSPIFDFCLSTRCSYAPCTRRECYSPQRLCVCLCYEYVCVWSLCKLMTQILWHRWLANVAISVAYLDFLAVFISL